MLKCVSFHKNTKMLHFNTSDEYSTNELHNVNLNVDSCHTNIRRKSRKLCVLLKEGNACTM